MTFFAEFVDSFNLTVNISKGNFFANCNSSSKTLARLPDQSRVVLHKKSIGRGLGPSKLIFSSKITKRLIFAAGAEWWYISEPHLYPYPFDKKLETNWA